MKIPNSISYQQKSHEQAIPDPDAAHKKLEELLAKQWTWFVLPNNCASFVEDVVKAGGSNAGLYFNCPTRERFI